jgi:beta-1,2-mannobiose phosphorylase / 1,2-beta-oligomannan phosphorylase
MVDRIAVNTPPVSNIKLTLERFSGNPILSPDFNHRWETKAVFNPAAIYENGKVHILYRAIGESDVSVLGYASSIDGLHINERLDKPAYIPREPFEGVNPSHPYIPEPSGIYVSGGGGMGGCEDPRLTRIGKTVYMTYVAYDGHSHPRVALSSINLDDFLAHRWYWKKPVLITPPYIVDKNACILPEKVNGKYVIFHRVFPNILIDFVDDLDFDGKSRFLTGQYKIPTRALSSDWDSLKVGCGPPPLKTKDGWLLIYQAVGASDESRYKIGAMLLDLKDPTKVLARTRNPILEPVEVCENEGCKAGVVYPCGAVIINERLFVYYGGADMVVCVATAKLNRFLEELVTNHKEAKPVSIPVRPKIMEEKFPQVKASCIKCGRMVEIKNPRRVILKNMRHTIQGICPWCGGKLSRFVKSNEKKQRKKKNAK